MLLSIRFYTLLFLFSAIPFISPGQLFTKIVDQSNPIVTEIPTDAASGASWVDYDNDNDLDLFVNAGSLFRNEGSGNFIKVQNSGIDSLFGWSQGNTWGDYDNDGNIDVYIANFSSRLYKNNGDGSFFHVNTGDIGASPKGQTAAFGDYNNDGFLDVVVTFTCPILGPCQDNRFFENNGNGSFTNLTDTELTEDQAAYWVPNWTDFDMDGDMDLFIGCGNITTSNELNTDYLFQNMLTETGVPSLERLSGIPLADDLREAVQWNWIDFDNDRDFDGFVTNRKWETPNDFYRNDNGVFVKMTSMETGANMVSSFGVSVSNIWGDFDNDGDLDAIITNDDESFNTYYSNNGDGSFSSVSTAFTSSPGYYHGSTAGDYDNDGDLDVFIQALNHSEKGLFRNNSTGNQWVNICLMGTVSNRSAIGAKVHALATINGEEVWQLREVNAQNSYNGMNSLRVHFGLGDASIVDSLVIEWPSGLVEEFSAVQPENFYKAIEGQGLGLLTSVDDPLVPNASLFLYPNPSNNKGTSLTYKFTRVDDVFIDVYSMQGKHLPGLSLVINDSMEQVVELKTNELAGGTYLVVVRSGEIALTKILVIQY